jgi:ABC-2 type transport system permease protein
MHGLLIARRELGSLLRAPGSYLIAGLVLLVEGLLFNAFALGVEARPSSQVLEHFFQFASGTTMVVSILVAMRPIAEDRSTGALLLLTSAPVRSVEVVLGKFLAAWTFVLVLLALSGYMPALVAIHGRPALGHIATGYLALALLSGTCVSLGLLGSALARSQLVAGMIGASLLMLLLLGWLLARLSDPPLAEALRYLALWQTHFLPAQRGILRLSDVVYMLSVGVLALSGATLSLRGERWA